MDRLPCRELNIGSFTFFVKNLEHQGICDSWQAVPRKVLVFGEEFLQL
jgi:hypothetical protein